MAKKIDSTEDDFTQEDPNLIKQVDNMMDPSVPDFPVDNSSEIDNQDGSQEDKESNQQDQSGEVKPIDIFADSPGTAPLLDKKTKKAVQKSLASIDDQAQTSSKNTDNTPIVQEQNNDHDEDALETNVEEDSSIPIQPDQPLTQPDEYDDPKLADAISDIVAQESDEVLLAEDSLLLTHGQQDTQVVEDSSSGHPFFWTLVAIVCLAAIGIALFLVDPNIYHPLSKLHLP